MNVTRTQIETIMRTAANESSYPQVMPVGRIYSCSFFT